ncbi:MAG: hypothetical protein CTY16_15550 [Methylobacter sp.]|nr:MAG: hypothetical protein CTY16_15550 [Methylobacter sp.]
MNSNSTNQSVTSINEAPMQDQVVDKVIIEQDEVKPTDLDALKELLKTNKEIEAQKLLESFLSSPDVTVVSLFQTGELFMEYQVQDLAETTYRAILEIEKNNTAALGRLGDLAQKKGDHQAAIGLFQQIIENEATPEQWVYIGLEKAIESIGEQQVENIKELLNKTRLVEAESLLRAYLLSQEVSSVSLFRAADLFNEQQMSDIAEMAYRAILDIDKSNCAALGRLGDLAQRKGNHQAAISLFHKIIENEATPDSWVYIGLGNALESIGDLQEAITYFRKAVDIIDNKEELLSRIDSLSKKLDGLQRGIPIHVKTPEIELRKNDNFQSAIPSGLNDNTLSWKIGKPTIKDLQLTRELAQQTPENPFIWQSLGDIAHNLGRWKEASDAYYELAKLQKLDCESHYRLGEALEHLYEYEKAYTAYLQGFTADPDEKILSHLLKIGNEQNLFETYSELVLSLFDVLLKEQPEQLYRLIDLMDQDMLVELFKNTTQKSSLISILPHWLENAEAAKDWTIPLELLGTLDRLKLLDPLPDWIAVESLWIAAQLKKILEISLLEDIKLKVKIFKDQLSKLRKFTFWRKAVDFDRQFPLLNVARLKYKQNWGKISEPYTLSEFFAHPESPYVSPHVLFDTIGYINAQKLSPKEKHPLVHFFRHSNGYSKKAPDPSAYFDCQWYREEYLEDNQIDNPLLHYLSHFHEPGIRPNRFFDNHYVRETQGLLWDEDPLTYYLTQIENIGADFCLKGFSPNPFFDRNFYLNHNQDILRAVQNKLDPFLHYIRHGVNEKRQIHAWQRYNEFVRHQQLHLEPFNWHSRLGINGSLAHMKGEKAEVAYFLGQQVLAKQLAYRPLVSILVPVYQVKPLFFEKMIESVIAQTYDNWQLCLVDDASKRYKQEIHQMLKQYAAKDERIVYSVREKNGHICNTTNDCLALAQGEYIALLDHDDLLTPDALYEMVVAINHNSDLDIIYSDEDKVDEWGVFSIPYYKPDWSPHSLWSRMYTCHLTVYRKSLMDSVGGFRVGFEGSQDYDLMLRCSEKTKHIHHIPKVLYHWRNHAESTASGEGAKDYCSDAGYMAITDTLSRRGLEATVDFVGKQRTAFWVKPSVIDSPLVDIIIPSRNGSDFLQTCLQSIFEKSTYQNFKVTVIDNNSDENSFFVLVDHWKKQEPLRFQVSRDESPFNFAAINNLAVQKTEGDYLVFLNNDTEIITEDWLEGLLGYAQLPEVGAVGTKLYYSDDTIQHAGVVTGISGIAGHAMKHAKRDAHGYFSNLELVTNYSVVTAACLMISREKFNAAGGFEEHLQVAFNDVDFCLKVRRQGLYNVFLPFVELYHYESKSRGYEDTPKKQERFEKEILFMRQRWGKSLDNDPFYSPWLTIEDETMGYRFH